MKRYAYAFALVGALSLLITAGKRTVAGVPATERKTSVTTTQEVLQGEVLEPSCPVYNLTAKFATYPLVLEWGENKDVAGSRR